MNFSYVIPGVIAGMALPGKYHSISEDLEFVKIAGIGAILTLTEDRLPALALNEFTMAYCHIPVRDFTALSMSQTGQAVAFLEDMASKHIATAVHCYAGIGRTGTIIACFLVARGSSALQAIQTVRKHRPGSIQGQNQENCIFYYEQVCKGS